MLQHEITPFADHHIEQLESVIDAFQQVRHFNENGFAVTEAELMEWDRKLKDARNALTRFKVCAEDEWKQKERYRKYAMENGYPYS